MAIGQADHMVVLQWVWFQSDRYLLQVDRTDPA